MILIALGVLRLATTKYTARSYITTAWIILLLPVLIINPNFVSITFVPIILLMAMGISTLLGSWYQLFPRNPYARIAGLVPLAILIGGMVFSGVDRYMYGYLYDPKTASNFSNDLQLVNAQLYAPNRTDTTLVVSKDEAPFYEIVASRHKSVAVVTSTPSSSSTTTIVTRAAYVPRKDHLPNTIVASGTANKSDRLYIYKTDQK
jgi:hypothetical protein